MPNPLFIYDDATAEIALFQQVIQIMDVPTETISFRSVHKSIDYVNQLFQQPKAEWPAIFFVDRNEYNLSENGVYLIDAIRRKPELAGIPIILWYNGWVGDQIPWKSAWGIGEAMLKPQQYENLVSTLRTIFNRYGLFTSTQE